MNSASPIWLECLEARIAPATLVDASTVGFDDADGDSVTVKFSKKVLLSQEALDEAFSFTPGDVSGETLDSIDLSKLGLTPAELKRVSISIVATQADGGDGFANVGAILGTGIDLGRVSVDGALGKITAGDTKGLLSLQVNSLGLADDTEPLDLSAVTSVILGNLGKLNVATDINKAFLRVTGSDKAGLGSAKIGGSLIGGDADYSGFLSVQGAIGAVSVGGSLIGGEGEYSGSILSGGRMGSLQVAGDLIGASGDWSGSVVSLGGQFSSIKHLGETLPGEGLRSGVFYQSSPAGGEGSGTAGLTKTSSGSLLINGGGGTFTYDGATTTTSMGSLAISGWGMTATGIAAGSIELSVGYTFGANLAPSSIVIADGGVLNLGGTTYGPGTYTVVNHEGWVEFVPVI